MSSNQVRLFLGHKGLGKSYAIKRALDRLPRHAPLYVWDAINHEYAGKHGKDPIANAIVFLDWREFLRTASMQRGHLGRVVLQCDERHFADFCRFAHACGGASIVLDELHSFVGAGNPKCNADALRRLLYTSRHRRLNVYAAAWRPTELPTWMRHACDEIHAFRTHELNDLEWYRATCGAEFVNKLVRLPDRRCVTHVSGSLPQPQSRS